MDVADQPKRRVLWISHAHRSINIDGVFAALQQAFDLTVLRLDEKACRHLAQALPIQSMYGYSQIVFDVPFSSLYHQQRYLRQFRHLVFYEEDACQNFIPESRWYKKFSRFYRSLNNSQVISTGYGVAARLAAEGITTFFVSKGYADHDIAPSAQERTIPLAFIGRTRSKVYKKRLEMLSEVSRKVDLGIMRSTDFADYVSLLQKIQVFFSADVGLGEYMAKNFEAMGAGCLLIAFRQGQGEEEALGLVDGQNVLLYDTAEQAIAQCRWALSNPELAASIVSNGLQHARTCFSHTAVGHKIANVLERISPVVIIEAPSLIARIKTLFR